MVGELADSLAERFDPARGRDPTTPSRRLLDRMGDLAGEASLGGTRAC